jgi:hypothetical protein
LISTQSYSGGTIKQNTYNSNGFIQTSEQLCNDNQYFTYYFTYDQYNRLVQIKVTVPKACDIDFNEGYTITYTYDYFDPNSPFQPSVVSVVGTSEAVATRWVKIDYAVSNGRFQAINGVGGGDGTNLDYFSADFTYDSDLVLTEIDGYYDIFNSYLSKYVFSYSDSLYTGYKQTQHTEESILAITWENNQISKTSWSQSGSESFVRFVY